MQLANDKAFSLYQYRPFRGSQHDLYKVIGFGFEQQGIGHVDIEATVELAANGSTRNVDLQHFFNSYESNSR
jgi:hypothetical protein